MSFNSYDLLAVFFILVIFLAMGWLGAWTTRQMEAAHPEDTGEDSDQEHLALNSLALKQKLFAYYLRDMYPSASVFFYPDNAIYRHCLWIRGVKRIMVAFFYEQKVSSRMDVPQVMYDSFSSSASSSFLRCHSASYVSVSAFSFFSKSSSSLCLFSFEI